MLRIGIRGGLLQFGASALDKQIKSITHGRLAGYDSAKLIQCLPLGRAVPGFGPVRKAHGGTPPKSASCQNGATRVAPGDQEGTMPPTGRHELPGGAADGSINSGDSGDSGGR